ncbi:MAG: hypothetical protein U9R56_06930 [candidate division Zixibacteria bacterium]|nr:hypothetical protein [candidate division Zixibacteria bacterium]
MRRIAKQQSGFGLIELTVIIIVIGVLIAVAMQSMTAVVQDARKTGTEREMEMLTIAIVGNPDLTSSGMRSDFGYVGDVGAFPTNLQALYENPGGYTTWDGPYIEMGFSQDSTGFKIDEWGTAYNYSGGMTITSTGSGSTITKKIVDASSDYLLNTLNGVVKDANDSLPGSTYKDSVDLVMTIPNGIGGTTTRTCHPDSTGTFAIDSLPSGKHPFRIIYTPAVDTLMRYVTILPRHKSSVAYSFASAYFSSGGGGSSKLTLRPDGAGASTNLTNSGCVSNYQCVDEVSSDGDGSRVIRASNTYARDTYSLDDPGVSSGTIDSVKVFCKAKKDHTLGIIECNLYTHSINYTSAEQDLTGSYADYSNTWTTNPNTSAAWTWTEINNLQAGLRIKGQNAGKPAYCTQVWVEVFYTE